MLSLFLSAAGQVALVAVLLGAGLPVLFAVGVRSFAVASGAGAVGAGVVGAGALAAGAPPARRSGLPAPLLRGIGALCFALVVGSVVIGLSVIIATGLGQSVSFEHMIPTFAPKG
ncbi:hypothetical protein C5C31_10815 [Rathayibacter rathayi]|uniref:hypothetical protein n=1 Tax=Rathayibacter rathayi TaxID=33887 RepID=UPI000CE74834|nr:hypothetical protein [Rathayibacter rathayi]PPG69244.1 hypothetical protein C5C02_06465 [Rathayibacter rathayi]PPG75793.1 hypothetical protein C5C23_09345 [Rathayibacter rathayi]PPH20831.1 hypothetical protein C5C31_10815 [Rathayibacter rathayi]PPI75806.1 hypothetical protein C5E03_12670 [Rathayibacter rathayi]